MNMILDCPDCGKPERQEFLPWTSGKTGLFSSISRRCEGCDKLEVFELGSGFDIGEVLVKAFGTDE